MQRPEAGRGWLFPARADRRAPLMPAGHSKHPDPVRGARRRQEAICAEGHGQCTHRLAAHTPAPRGRCLLWTKGEGGQHALRYPCLHARVPLHAVPNTDL